MTIDEIARAIIRGDYDANLDHLVAAINDRRKMRRSSDALANLLTLKPGTRVRTTKLSPKFLSGLTGEVVVPTGRRRDKDISVKLDHPVLARQYAVAGVINVPANCLEAL